MKDASAYDTHVFFTLDDGMDLNRLAVTIEKTVAAHPSIFVRIDERDGEPFQEFVSENYHQPFAQMTEAA